MGGIRTLGTRISLQVGEFPAEYSPVEQKREGEDPE